MPEKDKRQIISVKTEKIEIVAKTITLDSHTAWEWINELSKHIGKSAEKELPITASILKKLHLSF